MGLRLRPAGVAPSRPLPFDVEEVEALPPCQLVQELRSEGSIALEHFQGAAGGLDGGQILSSDGEGLGQVQSGQDVIALEIESAAETFGGHLGRYCRCAATLRL